MNQDSAVRWVHHHYEVGTRFEAGIKLLGTEVKAVREGRVDLRGSFVRVRDGEAVLTGAKIYKYSKDGSSRLYDPERPRVLLLNKAEIRSIGGLLGQKGVVIVPLKIFSTHRIIKVELGISRGKKKYDHREDLKKRQQERDIERELTGVTRFA